VEVFGTDGMLSPEFVTIGGKYAENAVFTGEFHPSLTTAGVREFVENYKNAFGETPDVVSARYYDATMMLLGMMEEEGAIDREKLLETLNNLKSYVGVSGSIARRPDGAVEKIPSMFTVEKGKITEYIPPPPLPVEEKAPEKIEAQKPAQAPHQGKNGGK
jgi:branched-chain amino acid transport system substrate-binding protein